MSFKLTAMQAFLLITMFLFFSLGDALPARERGSAVSNERRHSSAVPAAEKSITLIGTAVSRNSAGKVAIIVDERNGRQFLFREGSTYNGMTIRKILPDGITYTSAGGEGAMKLGRSPSPVARTLPIPSPQPASSSPAAVRRGERDLHYTLSRQKTASALSNPEKVVKAVKIAEGRLLNHKKGFRISSIETGSVFKDLGLHGGDLVLQVNGRGVSGKEGLRDIVEAIQGESSLDLTVRRRARTYQLGISIR